MRKNIEVAGQRFILSLPDGDCLWGKLGQYSPFVVADGASALFVLESVNELPEGDAVLLFDQETEPGEAVIRLFQQGKDWIAEMSPNKEVPVCARLWMSEDLSAGKLKFLSDNLSLQLFSVNNSLMLQYAFATACLGILEMHASVIKCDGKGYLFLARSGTGKSTHSQLWLKNIPGSSLLNDDNPIVALAPDGTVMVYGSPWSGKTPCYVNDSCPVGAFVQIRRCAENKITPLSVIETYIQLYSSSSGFKPDRKMSDGLHATMEKIVSGTRGFVLDCRPDDEAAFVCAAGVK